MNDGEHALWERWRLRKDDRAFEALVAPHLRFAAAFARRLGLPEADADDVVQGSLVRLAQERGQRPARVGLRAWLGREVLQGARMSFRAAHRRSAHERAAPVPQPEPRAPLEVHDEVERALATLPEKDRRAVELRFLHDLEYREIAHVLGTSALACRLRVHRALGRLRQRLGPSATLRVAALPLLGLSAHARALAEGIAGAHVATSAVAGGALLMGAGTKVAVAAVLVAGGLGLWYGWPERAPARPAAHAETAAEPLERPSLVGREGGPPLAAAPAGGVPADVPQTARAGGPPLDTPIPPGKGSVSGRVTFTDGTPARGLRVALSGYTTIDAVTDEDGRYHLHGEWVASRTLHVSGPRRYELGLRQLQLVADKRVDVDVTIERGVALEGVLLAERTREPVAGVLVVLRRPGANTTEMSQAGYGWVETDEAGRFRFEHVPPASYTLEVDGAAGFEARVFPFEVRTDPEQREFLLRPARPIRVRLENLPDAAKGTAVRWGWEPSWSPPHLRPGGSSVVSPRGELNVAAPPPGTWTLNVTLGRGLPSVSRGQVLVEESTPEELVLRVPDGVSVDGVLRDAAGLAVAGVNLTASGEGKSKTDAEGAFMLPWVAAGRTRFWIREEGLAVFVGEAEVPATGRGRVDLVLPGRASIRFRAVHGGDVTGGVASLSQAGAPIGTHSQAWPDSRGDYRFAYLAPGTYSLLVFAGSRPPYRADITLRADEERDLGEVRFPEAIDVPVDLVVPTGTQLPAKIDVYAGPVEEGGRIRAGAQATLLVAADGTAVLRGLPPGTYLITVMLEGFEMKEQTIVEIRGPRPDKLRFELRTKR